MHSVSPHGVTVKGKLYLYNEIITTIIIIIILLLLLLIADWF
jgi:hypothetical protein